MATEADPRAVFVEYRPNRRRWLAIVAAAVAVLLVLTVLFSVRWTVFSPTAVVHAYFQALSDRDVAAALRVTTGETADDLAGDLLAAAVLGSGDYAPPADLEIGEVTVAGRRAVAEVAFTIGGRPHATSLQLRRTDDFVDRLFQRWRIVDGVRPMRLGETPGEITVNGERVLAHDLAGARGLAALFGGYEVGVPADDPLWDARTVTVLVGPDRAREMDVPMVARSEVRAEVDRQLAALLDDCAASTELLPPGCPFGNARFEQATDVAWRIASYPTVGLAPGPDGFGQVAMLVRTTTEGEAVVTGVRTSFGREQPFEIPVPFPVSGVVTERGGAIVFDPSW